MRAAAADLMSIDLAGGDLLAATRASLLADSDALETIHLAQLHATAGTSVYADGMLLRTLRLGSAGVTATQTTLAQATLDAISAMRAVAYLPVSNITDAEPSTYYLTRNLVVICDGLEAAVVAAGAAVSSTGNYYSSPIVIFVACYTVIGLVTCCIMYGVSARALDDRLVPLRLIARLPNAVLQLLQRTAACSAAAAERAVEFGQTGAEVSGAESQEDERIIDWRSTSLALTSKDMQKGIADQRRDRIFLSSVLMTGPLLASCVGFILLAFVIWTGTQTAESSATALTGAILTQVAARQCLYYSILGATLSDDTGGFRNATSDAAATTRATTAARLAGMFFGASGDVAADAELQSLQFGDLCSILARDLSPYESARCGKLDGGVCRSGMQAVILEVLRGSEALGIARDSLTLPALRPSSEQAGAVRGLLDSQRVTDMRVMDEVEVAAGMAADGSIRAARVQAAVDSAIGTCRLLVSVFIVAAVAYQVRATAAAASV